MINKELRLLIKNDLEFSKSFRRYYLKEIYKKYQNIIDENIKFKTNNNQEKLYCFLNDIKYRPICQLENCNNEVSFYGFKIGFNQFCSDVCRAKATHFQRILSEFKKLNYTLTNDIKQDINTLQQVKHRKDFPVYYLIYRFYKNEINDKVKHISNENHTEKLFCYINNITKYDKCYCGNDIINFKDFESGYHTYCSNKCAQSDLKIIEKKRNTYYNNTGYYIPLQNPEVQEKMKQTNMRKIGVEYPAQDINIQEKMKQTYFQRTGYYYSFQNPEIREEGMLKKYGIKSAQLVPEIREKTKNTNIEKYGGTNPMHDPEIAERALINAYKMKDYIMPSGDIRKIQGYENFALDILLETYNENEILTDTIDMPEIWYEHNDSEHRYYPDIFIPHENKIIEVKSQYTFDNMKEINLLKQQACINADYNFEFWIMNDKVDISKIIICK